MSRAEPVVKSSAQPRLVSRSTILILSGWLIGAATTRLLPAEIEQFVTLVGLLGLIAFTGLESSSH